MRKRRLLMGVIAFPFPPRWLPAIGFGVVGSVGAFLLYLAATRGP
jgi:hypothetical protein